MPLDLRRRTFLKSAAAASVAVSLPACAASTPSATSASAGAAAPLPTAAKPLRLLVLGGTGFIGPALVSAALARGHEVTLFNRGRTQPWLFPGLELRRGNRWPELDDGLKSLRTGTWDAVFDLPAYYPRQVVASAELLKGRIGHYIMLSSIGVYQDFRKVGLNENDAVRELTGTYEERPDLGPDYEFGTYGARKVLCERAVFERFPGAATSIRPHGVNGGGLGDATKWY